MKKAFFPLILSIAFFCRSIGAEPPQFITAGKAGFVDATLSPFEVNVADDQSITIGALARAGNDDVGFLIRVSANWDAWKPPRYPGVFYKGTIEILSIGPKTEAFVRALAKAYGVKVEQFGFLRVKLAAISLQGDPRACQTSPVRLKVFYEGKGSDEYAEITYLLSYLAL